MLSGKSKCQLKGRFYAEHWRKGKKIGEYEIPNGIVDIGKNTLLDVMFRDAVSKIIDWTIGIIDNAGFTALADTDTMASHTGWVEFTGYSEGTRPEWDPVAAAAEAITNTTLRDFNVTSAGNWNGVFISDSPTKGGATGTLWATASFAGVIPVSISDVIKIQYTVAA